MRKVIAPGLDEWAGGSIRVNVAGDEIEAFLFVDVETGFLVDFAAQAPDDAGAPPVVAAFEEACRKAGGAPLRLRVSERRHARDLQGAGLAVKVVIGPTPELDEPIRSFAGFTASRADGEGDDVAPPPERGERAGRNDPCPCGSGRKYRRCHRAKDIEGQRAKEPLSRIHDLDAALVPRIVRHAAKRFGADLEKLFTDIFGRGPSELAEELEFAIPFVAYHGELRGKALRTWFLEREGRTLSARETAFIEAQGGSWVSVWEVREVEKEKSLLLRDLLTGEERRVVERQATRTLVRFQAILARVVDFEAESVLGGVHTVPLPPTTAAAVARKLRSWLQNPRAVTPEMLRSASFLARALKVWGDEADDLLARAASGPQLQNTDGDPLLMTEDLYTLASGSEGAVRKALAELPWAEAEGSDAGVVVYVRPPRSSKDLEGGTVVGRADVSPGALRLSTNSVKRADDLRLRVEAALGGLVTRKGRTHEDPASTGAKLRSQGQPGRPAPFEPIPEEIREELRKLNERAQRDWVDTEVPALSGKTPRAAATTKAGRERLNALLKEMEQMESRLPEGHPGWDFVALRRTLGLPPA